MLVLQTLTLVNVKRFKNKNIIDFSNPENKLISLSGNNGSGKTTILHSLMVAQMAFFIKENSLKEKNIDLIQRCHCDEKINQLLTDEKSQIGIKFLSDDQPCGFEIYVDKQLENSWNIEYDSLESKELIEKYWNITNPSCLFFYLGSDKHYAEESITYERIKISSKNNKSYLLDYILDYSRFSENMYQTLMNDYIKERVIPGNPRHDIYFGAAKILFNYLVPYITIMNFSGTKNPEFQLMVKNGETHSNVFDIRHLSSGEKTVFYLCLLLSYFTSIGLLLIDEPENHLHENLLNKLVNLLSEIAKSQSYASVLKDCAKTKLKINIEKYYTNYKLQKIIFVTHSKSLIYSNFQFGQNFIVDNKIQPLEYENAEKKLREIGLSCVSEKMLIVEGTTEEKLFDHILGNTGIRIYPVNGCAQVLDLYRKIRMMKDHLPSVNIAFMIDKDTRNKDKFEAIRQEDSEFYDEHFILLDKHEIENYFIDVNLMKDVCDKYTIDGADTISKDDLKKMIDDEENDTNAVVKQKAMNGILHEYIIDLAAKVKQKEIQIDSQESFKNYIIPIFDSIYANYLGEVTQLYNQMNSKYVSWNEKKNDLCDGKIAYAKVKSKLADKLDIKSKKVDETIYSLLRSDIYSKKKAKYFLTDVVREIMKKLELTM